MSTLTSPDISTLDGIDIDIECEHDGCERLAVVMSKGCGDDRHHAICSAHLKMLRDWFNALPPGVVCAQCHRPCLHLETHFDIVRI